MMAATVGLGWPHRVAQVPRPDLTPGAAGPPVAGGVTIGLGWPTAHGARDQTPGPPRPPERLRQAVAAVSRETQFPGAAAGRARGAGAPPRPPGNLITDPAPASRPLVTGVPPGPEVATAAADGRQRTAGGPGPSTGEAHDEAGESEDDVAIAAGPDGSADTPIARAAQAAVVARSGGQQWPRPGSCRIMTIANQKGGVGKTTTAVNLAASLAMHGARVLVVDLDPQGNASTALDVDHHAGVGSVYNVLVEGQPLSTVVCRVAGFPHLYCAPATIDLAGAEIELVPLVARESRLARALAQYDASGLDYILIDCPPSLGLLTVNALVAAPEVLIPIQCEYYALEGLEQLLRTVELVKSHLNPGLTVTTIVLTMYDARTRLAAQVADEVRQHFGDVVLASVIPRSVRVSEAPSYGQSVMTYDPGSSGAQAYLEAARELAYRDGQLAVS
jgi:chromosome partitioning protein